MTEGHDGPYPAPIETAPRRVPAEWIDYNGHMNVGYYSIAMDQALDRMFDAHLGLGAAYTERTRHGPYVLQMHMHYLGEILEGESFTARFTLLDHDAKRLHILGELVVDGTVRALSEQLIMGVDLETRRSAPYPDWAQARFARMLADHAHAPRPPQIGRPLGIRR
ncbi:thioesterase family protein [Roseobacter sp. HKCCA0434]|uniref:thioesterase family protein n=1 Tax=Roseobacter sp. HKCCA0434 TaxID=3079297 RepID=UPI002905C951|nr:thioesterase family protein [Roseobacter sp. HKCCA0434]